MSANQTQTNESHRSDVYHAIETVNPGLLPKPDFAVLDLLKGFEKTPLTVDGRGRLLDGGADDPSGNVFKYHGFSREEGSILSRGFDVKVQEPPKPEKGFFSSLGQSIFGGKSTAEVAEEKFGNTLEGKLQQQILLSKMSPKEQAILLQNDDPRMHKFITEREMRERFEVHEKFAKLVRQEMAEKMDSALKSLTPGERNALKQEMREMKNNAKIDFQTGTVELPEPGPNVRKFYERLAQQVLGGKGQSVADSNGTFAPVDTNTKPGRAKPAHADVFHKPIVDRQIPQIRRSQY